MEINPLNALSIIISRKSNVEFTDDVRADSSYSFKPQLKTVEHSVDSKKRPPAVE